MTRTRKYLLKLSSRHRTIDIMAFDLDPIIGNWYQHRDKGQLFTVVAVDESTNLIELQHFDGDLEALEFNTWNTMDLELSAEPEDWTGPADISEQDDLGYSSETGMMGEDWRKPLAEVPGGEKEAWEDERTDDEAY